uniref:Uncharacterized protein n=1 Tax=Nephromyces sp. ex Molgula occidentalis TaxID=2544991 RepID=A0A5C1H887_9APIC|nr:hypothetical protein [Nephromyces sp. ex Molgula occidentalis]
MIFINIKNKKIFYKNKKFEFKINNNNLGQFVPKKSKIEFNNLIFDKNKLKYSFYKGIIIKKEKNNLLIKSKGYITKIPIYNPKIKNIKIFN